MNIIIIILSLQDYEHSLLFLARLFKVSESVSRKDYKYYFTQESSQVASTWWLGVSIKGGKCEGKSCQVSMLTG